MKTAVNNTSELKSIAKKRASQLLIPYTIWGLGGVLWGTEKQTLASLILNPGANLWFLWDLFFIYIAFASAIYLSTKLRKNLIYGIVAVFAVLVIISLLLPGIADTFRIYRLYIFFTIGFYCKRVDLSSSKWRWYYVTVLFAAYFLSTYFWVLNPNANVLSNQMINSLLSSNPYRMFVSLTGCFTFLFIGQLLSGYFNSSILSKLGRITLGIYAIHLFIINTGINLPLNMNYYMALIVLSITLLLVSCVIYFVMSKFKITRLLFLGMCG